MAKLENRKTQNERIKTALKLRRGHPQFGPRAPDPGPLPGQFASGFSPDGNAKVDGSARVVQETPFTYLTTRTYWAPRSPSLPHPWTTRSWRCKIKCFRHTQTKAEIEQSW